MAKKESRQFEDKMKRLEEIVAALEAPDLSLEECMALYKEGVQCSRFCRDKLEKARHELEIWQNEDGRGEDAGPEAMESADEQEN